MQGNLKKLQSRIVRNNIERYRFALENYYIKNKPLVKMRGGHKAFSLLSPPVGSVVERRRIRFIMNNIIDDNTKIKKNKIISWGRRTPHFTTIAVTYKCQCNCLHCSAQQYKEETESKQSALGFQEIKSIIDQAIEIGTTCIVFTGGEPLLYEKIYDLINTIDKSKAVCTIFTNGEYLNEKSASLLKEAGIFGVFVSLDFTDSDKHNKNRQRKGIFEKAIRGIRVCQERNILTGISTFITKEKLLSGELDAMMNLGKKLKVLEVFLFDIIATGRLMHRPDCILSKADIDKVRKFRGKYNSDPDYPRIIHQTMFTSIAYPCVSEGCPAGVAQIHIRGNGDVSPCDFTPLSFGNIRHKSLRELWQNIIGNEIYSKPSQCCRLSDSEFCVRLDMED